MDDVKHILASRTFWGAAIAALATGLRWLGYELNAVDQTMVVDSVFTVITVAGSLLAIYGRVKATKTIGSK